MAAGANKWTRFLRDKWINYRFRFVPWVAMNMQHKLKESARIVPSPLADPLIPPSDILSQIWNLVPYLIRPKKAADSLKTFSEKSRSIMLNKHGFKIDRAPSLIPGGGTGVFVTKGKVRKGRLVALYPGTIYRSFEPILLPSINNPFIFRCLDGTHLDGKNTGLSRIIFKSCVGRDKMGPLETADLSWLTNYPINPLNVGQYVNNHTKDYPSNVAYQECELPDGLDPKLRSMLPYINYAGGKGAPSRLVALVATRDIKEGKELLSSYLTLVGSKQ
ncbi:SET domain-containing protein 9-like [Neocloeon triangulifer]|uniref:SET domain-containing protein 9-like n=1 Tax=Neocloeon triangulifer TaxID=2078957 RepID=UPI00286ECD34|nr:SET domain-containing protein 9-like [Neocloeon triangulifer]